MKKLICETAFVNCSIQLDLTSLLSSFTANTPISIIPTIPIRKNQMEGCDVTAVKISGKTSLLRQSSREQSMSAKPSGITIRICIKRGHIFSFFITTMIFQSTFPLAPNRQRTAPSRNNLLEKIVPITIQLAPKKMTGIASVRARKSVKSSGTISFVIFRFILPPPFPKCRVFPPALFFTRISTKTSRSDTLYYSIHPAEMPPIFLFFRFHHMEG